MSLEWMLWGEKSLAGMEVGSRMNHAEETDEAFLIDGFSHIRPAHLGAIAITGNAQGAFDAIRASFLQIVPLISFSAPSS